MACSSQWPVYDKLVDRPPQYRRKLSPEVTMEIAKQASNYQTAMELLVRLDISRALPLLTVSTHSQTLTTTVSLMLAVVTVLTVSVARYHSVPRCGQFPPGPVPAGLS